MFETGVDVVAPMERVEMDECKLDIKSLLAATGILEHLPPERRAALEQGRRWICVAIDCATKSILALRLSENPSADEAIRTLRDVYTDKTAIAQACGCESTWPQSGQIGLLAKPKFTAHADPASQWTAARKGPAFFAYSDNYLIDTDHGIIMDVDASRSNKAAEVGARCSIAPKSASV